MARELKFDREETTGIVETAVGQTIEKLEAARALNVQADREHTIRLFNRGLILLIIAGALFLVWREQGFRYQVEAAKVQLEAAAKGLSPRGGGPQGGPQ